MMKSAELKGKGLDELTTILASFKKELFNLRFQKANGSLNNTSRVSAVKKSIARINTLINAVASKNEEKNA